MLHTDLGERAVEYRLLHGPRQLDSSLVHYRYADDPPLCPAEAGSSLLVMDFDPASPGSPTVSSLSPRLAVDNVAVLDAPGAGSTGYTTGSASSNNNLYIVRTLALSNDKHPPEEPTNLAAALELFSQRNAELRKNFEYSMSSSSER